MTSEAVAEAPSVQKEEFQAIIDYLKQHPLEVNKYRSVSGSGRSQAFGVCNKRCLPPDYSRQCWKHPYLYKLLLDFGANHVPFSFNAVTVNCNYKAAPHYDKNNDGNSYLIAFGSYTGGELELLEGDRKGVYDICGNPIIDDFSKVLHCVRDFEGERYSLVFYTFKHPRWTVSLPPPSVREVDGKWKFFRGDTLCDGLPHPLKGRMKTKKLIVD